MCKISLKKLESGNHLREKQANKEKVVAKCLFGSNKVRQGFVMVVKIDS